MSIHEYDSYQPKYQKQRIVKKYRARVARQNDTHIGCNGKKQYDTAEHALWDAKEMNRKKTGRRHAYMHVYRCLECSGWHVGSNMTE